MTVQLITRYVKLLIVFAVLWVGLVLYGNFGCRKVEGMEMEPALKRESHKWTAPKLHTPEDFQRELDLISYTYVHPGKQQTSFAARVIGLPGDRVRIEKGDVYVNGSKINSNYVAAGQRTTEDYAEITVPRDTVFVLCDARRSYKDYDSRTIGPVGAWAIAGKFR